MKMTRLFFTTVVASLVAAHAGATAYKGTMNADQHLLPGDSLTSLDGKYSLIMKVDGSIARVGPKGEFWNPGVFGQELLFQWDSNLVLYDTGRQHAIWTVNKGIIKDQPLTMTILFDGSLQVTAVDRHVVWTLTGDPKYNDPGSQTCPGGATPQPYPACANAGTSYQFSIPIPACSPAEAAQLARASGFTPGACH